MPARRATLSAALYFVAMILMGLALAALGA
jgi:hypothetical protein